MARRDHDCYVVNLAALGGAIVRPTETLAIDMAICHGRALCAVTRRCLTHTAKFTARTFVAQCVRPGAVFVPRVFAVLDTPVSQHPSGVWRRRNP